MNDLLHDIKKLDEAKHHLILAFNTTNSLTTQKDIQNAMNSICSVINEKQLMVDNFEKQAPQDIQDLCICIRGGK